LALRRTAIRGTTAISSVRRAPLKLKDICAIRVRLQLSDRTRHRRRPLIANLANWLFLWHTFAVRNYSRGNMPHTKRTLNGLGYRLVTAALAIGGLLTSGLFGVAVAQSYPTRPIKLVVPFPAGGPADVLGRLITQKLSESFGSPVIVDNRSGANGIIGTDLVAKAAPDGYTMLINTGSTTINAHVYSKLPYDLMRDLAPVTMVAAPRGSCWSRTRRWASAR